MAINRFIAFIVMSLAVTSAFADEEAVKAKTSSIEQKAAVGQYKEAWDDLQELQTLLWEKRPLGVSSALFVQKPADGYGLYVPRETSEFKKDEPMFVYLQPVGYGFERADDLYRIALTVDFELRTPNGQVLAEEAAFSRLSLESRAPNREFQASFSFTFEGLDPGRYSLLFRLRDENGGQRSEISLPFTIAAVPDEETAD